MRVVLALLVWLAGVALAAPVLAHAVLVETIPADRAVLAQAPAQILLRFNEPVRPVAVQVLDHEGRRVAGDDDAQARDNALEIAVGRALPNGSYVVSYRVISADAHPVSGSFLFAVGPAPETWAETAPREKPPVHWPALAAIDRAVFLACALLSAGGALFLLLFRGNDRPSWLALRPIVQASALLGVLAALLGVGLQGALIAGAGSGALRDVQIWQLGAESTRGRAAAVSIIGFMLLAVALARTSRGFAFLGIGAIVASFVLSGHAATAPHWGAVPALLLHAVAAAFWLGAFVPLLQALDRRADAASILQRFSVTAIVIVPLLLAAGIVLAVLQVQQVDALLSTNYGVTLLLKLGAVLALIAIAAVNRLVLAPRLEAGRPTASWLRRTIRAELAVGLIILVLTSILSQTIPPRSLGAGAHDHVAHRVEGYAVVMMQRGRMAVVEVEPARAGRNTIALHLSDAAGGPAPALEVAVELSNAAAGVAPLRRRLTQIEPGRYAYIGPELALAGRWTLRLDVLVSDFEKAIYETAIVIR